MTFLKIDFSFSRFLVLTLRFFSNFAEDKPYKIISHESSYESKNSFSFQPFALHKQPMGQ